MRSVMKLLFENYFTTVKFPKFEREEEERRTYDLFEKSLDEIQKKLFLEWESVNTHKVCAETAFCFEYAFKQAVRFIFEMIAMDGE